MRQYCNSYQHIMDLLKSDSHFPALFEKYHHLFVWCLKLKINELIKAINRLRTEINRLLDQIMPLASFYNPWKHQKTRGLIMFSGGIERDRGMKVWKTCHQVSLWRTPTHAGIILKLRSGSKLWVAFLLF